MSTVTPLPGHPLPLGTTIHENSVCFSIFSRHARRVWLMLFSADDNDRPCHEFELDPIINRSGDIWHIELQGINEGQRYLYRMDGPYQPEVGHRFNPYMGLIDPYAKALTKSFISTRVNAYAYEVASPQQDLIPSTNLNFADLPKCVVVSDEFDWQGDKPLNRRLRHTIIYEAHLRGLTAHPTAKVTAPGTYQGIIDLIPYFQDLGVTAIEFLPLHAFDRGSPFRHPETKAYLTNYWGYDPISFFAPEPYYSASDSNSDPIQQIHEFKTMVRELHKAGLEIILDVVYNHTGEFDHSGPTISFRGLDNQIYYLLEEDKRFYKNYAGTGNTFNCNHPVVRDFILDSLRYWVTEYHIDGFRFDLASILGRDQAGHLLENPPIVERIAEDPILRNTKIIAEAWDAAGAYQVGSFPGRRWSEWNGRYRDDVRRFWRGDSGTLGPFATRFTGSSDLYGANGRTPIHSINFVTAHDGFTLNDIVSYNQKHNLANGENNRDGHNYNFSDNLGQEGPAESASIERRRTQRIKNFLTTLMLSQGVPMLLAGDEFRRTQQGNNNAYAQDNEIAWIDWSFKEKYQELYTFTRALIAFRRRHPIFYRPHFFQGHQGDTIDIQWFTADGNDPHWHDTEQTLGCLIHGSHELIGEFRSDNDALIMFNASPDGTIFSMPPAPNNKRWKRIIDTALLPPLDIQTEFEADELSDQTQYDLSQQSMVVLLSF